MITKSNWGGAQRYVFDLATSKYLEERVEVVVALGGNGELSKKLSSQGIRTLIIPELERDINIINDVKTLFWMFRTLKKERPDILHLNSSKIGLLGGFAGRALGVKRIIFTAHGWAFTEARSGLGTMLLKYLQWVTVLLSHKTIVVSQSTYEEISDLPYMSYKVEIIYNGIGEILLKEKNEARSLLDLSKAVSDGGKVIGTISELHKNKGLDYAIKAFAQILRTRRDKNLFLVIIGEGEERQALLKLIKNEQVGKNVILIGFIKDASTYLHAFDIFILSSLKEGFPYAILEAGKAGLPVVASATGGILDIIEHERTGYLVSPKDTDELVEKINTMLQNDTERNDMANNLHRLVEERFSLKKMISKTSFVYNI